MQTVTAHFTHKISPKDTDVSEQFEIADGAFSDSRKLGAALRKQRILQPGQRIRSFKVTGDKVVVFPSAGIWQSITLKFAPAT